MAYCDKCGYIVAEKDIVPICISRQTWGEPAEYAEYCKECIGQDRDEDYERAQASDAWQRRGGGGL
jgi:hypothetical protein